MIALGVISLTGCSAKEPIVATCPPLPANLEPDALKKMPRSQALTEIRENFGIQLPPTVTYTDISHQSHSTSYKFVYSPFELNFAGYTPWFTNQFEGKWGSEWGDLMIFETTFTQFEYNAYDIADAMVHEATHAWQQYTLVQLAQDTQSTFMQNIENHSYFTWEWGEKYTNVLEYEASSYVLQHTPAPLCTSPYARKNETRYREKYSDRTPVVGLEQSPWPMPGYPLP